MITAAQIRKWFIYNRRTGILRWRNRTSSFGGAYQIGDVAGCFDSYGYAIVKIHQKIYKQHRIIWVYVTGKWPRKFIDHINGIPQDNRWANLREASYQQNVMNKRVSKNNKVRLKGVTPSGSRWAAAIKFNLKTQHLGTFDTPQKAHAAYVAKARELFGEFSRY